MPQPIYMGPRLRRLRRELGLTQADMARDLEISPSYVALLERNQRPLTAEMLLRLARTYRLDMAEFAGDGGAEDAARLQAVLRDPMFADIDLPKLQNDDVATNYPGITEAFLRLYTAYREEQLALADRGVEHGQTNDAVAEVRRFLNARRNSFPMLDDAAGTLAETVAEKAGLTAYLAARHGLKVRRLPPDVMFGAIRRLDRHRRELLLDESLDAATHNFQLALQLVWLEMRASLEPSRHGGSFHTENGERLGQGALANYAAAALIMPYAPFARAVETRHYDVELLARQFGTSFEQTAHRLTTLQKPGHERVPFFFIRVDAAGNVSKRFDGAGFPFARHGGGCPLWSLHHVFRTPRQVVTQWLELPDGQRFFSIARTVTSGGGAWGRQNVERAVALGCAAEHADRLIYTRNGGTPAGPTPIGVTCALCQRIACPARAAPPIGRQLLSDANRRPDTPFGFADSQG